MIKRLITDQSGATMVEYTLVLLPLMLLTFGVADFANLYWQWNSAEKATEIGIRHAVVSTPVAQELATYECGTAAIGLGTPCRSPAATTFGRIVCSGSTLSCSNGFTFSGAAFDALVARMQQVYGQVQRQNVVVEYNDLRLGFVGRGGPVPAVTVRLTGMTFRLAVINGLLGVGATIAMPDFRATLIAEDLQSAGVS